MGRRNSCVVTLVLMVLAVAIRPGHVRADQARSVGYVLSFRLGIEVERAQELVDELAKATSDWQGLASPRGEPVSKSCASSRKCVREVSSALGVSRLGVVAIVATGGVVRVDVRLLDANTGGEILRTHVEYESGAGESKAQRAIFDLIPRLLPGEKAAPVEVAPSKTPAEVEPPVRVPPVQDISEEPVANELDLRTPATPKQAGTRWWLWGGLGAAATAAIVTGAILMTRDDSPSGPILELPPPQ